MSLEDEFKKADADDFDCIGFIRNYLPQELKEKFSDDELYYFIDCIDDYYTMTDVFNQEADADGWVEIDLEKVADFIVEQAKKQGVGDYDYDPVEMLLVVQAELAFAESLDE